MDDEQWRDLWEGYPETVNEPTARRVIGELLALLVTAVLVALGVMYLGLVGFEWVIRHT